VSGVLEAALWGLVGASALLLGAVLAFTVRIPLRVRGWIQGFGAGVLFGAVAYELVEEAVRASAGGSAVGIGFALGAIVFYVGSVLIDSIPTKAGASGDGPAAAGDSRRSAGLAVLLGTVLDGIPESVVLGLSFVPGEGVAAPILLAIFLSNVPEALSATEDLAESGFSRKRIMLIWIGVALSSAVAAGLGFAMIGVVGNGLIVATQAFAAGALVAMLAESMIPEAYETGGRPVGLATALGFALAAYLSLQP
jgi:zinc transporter, ZIP family